MEQCWLLIISILVWVPASINGDTDPSDAAALNAMYLGLNSPSLLTGWSASGNDPCGQNWRGVTCSGSRVTRVEVSNLGLTGSLGFQLMSLSSVTDFDASNNNLGGSIPYPLPQNVQRLNLAFNSFNGAIPYSISNMTSLQNLNLAHNQLNQQLNDMFQRLSQLSVLDLSSNQIPGPLPYTFSSLSNINSMHLENNQFTGTIDILANLPLDTLNIENNHFTGWIPDQLQGINLKTNGNSFNSGPAPPPPPGTPPAIANHHRSGSKNASDKSGGKGSGIGGGGVAGIVISLLVVGAVVIFFLVKKRSQRPARDIEKSVNQPLAPIASANVHEAKVVQNLPSIDTVTYESAPTSLKPPPFDHKSFDEDDMSNNFVPVPMPDPVITKKATTVPPNVKLYSIADLQMATGSFSIDNLLGEGSIGRVYRAEFDDGEVLAVKKIDSNIISSYPEDFTVIVASISQFENPNISKLVGYCSEHGQHLLVYEFHKNASLHDFLHLPDEFNKPLSWNSRVKIALGSARALEYLHEACSPSVVHKNFKSENILLDGEMNPHVSDCGLSSLVPDADQAVNHNACAPEVADSGQYSLKSDVYSFGVVMLELLTGRKPFNSSKPRSEQSLVRWATPQLHDIDSLTKMVDPDLEGLYPVKSLSRFADVIALCIQPEPEFRPPMSEVVQALVRLVQRANMSKRTVGARQMENSEDDNSVN